jgi:predicted ATP-binding protein involved in virulence
MHLKQVTIRNFRSFESLSVALHPRLTVLVAENGGGKTAILDAIAIGLAPVLRLLSSANQRLKGPGFEDTDFRLVPWLDRTGEQRWVASDYAQVVLETSTGLKWDNWRPSQAGKQPESKVGQSALAEHTKALLDRIRTDKPDVLPVMLPVFAYYGARRGWILIPDRLRESKEDYTHPTSALVGSLDALTDFKEMLKWFDAAESSELRRNKEAPGSEWTPSTSLSEVREAVSAILGGDYSNPHFNEKHRFVVESRKGAAVLQVCQLSQGYQSMLALAMDFARRLALANPYLEYMEGTGDWAAAVDYYRRWEPEVQSGMEPGLKGPRWSPALMLVDEIDLHLHPRWQQRVLHGQGRVHPYYQGRIRLRGAPRNEWRPSPAHLGGRLPRVASPQHEDGNRAR